MTLTTAAAPQLDNENPWPGLASFEESAHAFFFGRNEETSALLRHVLDTPVTVLYGRSGLGKTSLLRAGLFPRLRELHLLPVYVRFDLKPGALALSEQLRESVSKAIQAEAPEVELPADSESLWEFLHRKGLELWSAENQLLTPVVVFDQFEEIFTLGERVPELVEIFRDELGDLAENRIPAELAERIEKNEAVADQFDLRSRNNKLLISLREDFLPALEEWCGLIPSLGRSRVRLHRLRADQALDAVHEPAGGMISDGLARQVVGIVAGKDLQPVRETAGAEVDLPDGDLDTADVEPALLSLFCRELNEMRKRRGLPRFDEQLVEDAKEHTLANYYTSCVSILPPGVARFIESELITETGFRDRYIREDAVPRYLTEKELEQLIQSRLLRLEQDRYGAQWIELTHDVLTDVVRRHRDARRAEEDKAALAARTGELDKARKRSRVLATALALTVAVSLVAAVLGLFAYDAQRRAMEAQRQAHENLEAATAQKLIAEAQGILNRDTPGEDEQAFQEILAARLLDPSAEGSLYTALAQRVSTFKIMNGHDGFVNNVSFSPDGDRLASAGDDSTVRLWNADTGNQIGEPFKGHTDMVEFATFSPDGRRLASASWDKTVRIWDVDTGEPVGEPLEGHTDTVRSVAFSPSGDGLATASDDRTVRLWDADTGRPLGGSIQGHSDLVTSVVFSPDGTRLATASVDKTVRMWDVNLRRQIGEPFTGHESAVAEVAFSPDGRRLASAGWDKSVRLWDADTGKQIGDSLKGHSAGVRGVVFSPDGLRLATAGVDKMVRLWDVGSGLQIGDPFTGHDGAVTGVKFSPDARHLASASWDGTVRLWNVDTGEPLRGHTDEVLDVLFSPEGDRLASFSSDHTVRLWDPDTGLPIGEPLGHADEVTSLAFSADGHHLATASWDDMVRLWDPGTGRLIGGPLAGHTDNVNYVEFGPAGNLLASASADGTVRLWDAGTGRPLGEPLRGHTEAVHSVSFSPDGHVIASASADDTVRLWDAETHRQIGDPLSGHADDVWGVFYSPDGRRLATAGDDDTVRLWDPNTARPIGKPIEHTYRLLSAWFSPDGQRLATASFDNAVWLWNTDTAELTGDPLRHTDMVTDMEFSPDGHHLATASADQVRLWNPETGDSVGAPLKGHAGEIFGIAFSPDGHQLASGSADGSVRLWPAEASPEMLCGKLMMNMSHEQWDEWVSPDIPYQPLCPGLPVPN